MCLSYFPFFHRLFRPVLAIENAILTILVLKQYISSTIGVEIILEQINIEVRC